jgi:Arc/MetJ-type ribon-helix-helix transcriptional regulator
MSTIGIQLPDDLRAYLQEEAARRGYKDQSEFVQALLEAEKLRNLRKDLETMLLEAVDGPFTPWTDTDVEDIEREGMRLIQQRKAR